MQTEKEMHDLDVQAKKEFLDWMGWDGKPPSEDDPDYYTYHWGMHVWISCTELIAKRNEANKI